MIFIDKGSTKCDFLGFPTLGGGLGLFEPVLSEFLRGGGDQVHNLMGFFSLCDKLKYLVIIGVYFLSVL